MLTFNFDPFPELETERLRLRRMREEDTPDLFLIRSDRENMRFLARPLLASQEEARKLFETIEEGIAKNEHISWGICLKSDDRVIGTIGYYRMKPEHYRAEVGYVLHRDFQGRGVMSEALTAVLGHGFKQMKLHSIEAVTDPLNEASQTLLRKHGFVKEAHFRENFYFEGRFLDSVHYSLLNSFTG